jgi:L-ribulokinase
LFGRLEQANERNLVTDVSIVAGVDFGTLSVRVSIFDHQKGRLGSGVAEYPLLRKKEDPDHATQKHADHMAALVLAMQKAREAAGIDGREIASIALDTTGSSIVPVGEGLQPLDDYYLWCDHRAWREAARITRVAHETNVEAIRWSGGAYSSEWGFAKLLHWLRTNPEKRGRMVTALEHCDMVAATLCGITEPAAIPRSICAMGHKWMWNRSLGGFPPDEYWSAVDPLLAGIGGRIGGRYATSDQIAGRLSPEWAGRLGLSPGIPIPVGAIDAHWDAVGAGVRLGDVVNVIGTSTCIMAISEESTLVPGVCGVVPGSIHPRYTGIEAGLSATGDIFDAIARRANSTVAAMSQGLDRYRAGETGLLRLTWDNGDRTVLVNPELGGVTFGWSLASNAQDELFAAIEGTAFHTRVILERMEEHGVPVHRIVNAGGIPQKNETLNHVYANVLNKPILVPRSELTSLGSAIFAFLAAGTFKTVEEAQDALCPSYKTVEPDGRSAAVYQELFAIYRRMYFAMGRKDAEAIGVGGVLPALRGIAAQTREAG